jgi:hypothetical protein
MTAVHPHLAAATVPTYIVGSRTLDGIALLVIAAGIWIGWFLVARDNWENIIHSLTRLGYLIGDCALLAPGCVTSGIGLLLNESWGPPTLLIAVGAAAFDLTHTFIYLAEICEPKVHGKPLGPWVYAAAILVTLGVLGWIAWRAIYYATGDNPPWYLWLLSAVAAAILVAGVVYGVRAVRKLTPPPDPLGRTRLEL